MSRVQRVRVQFRRRLLRHRRLLAAGLTAVAVASALGTLRPGPGDTVAVQVAARDLPAGTRLSAADVTTVDFPTALAPAGGVDPVGSLLAGPMRAGEPIVDLRLVDSELIATFSQQGLAVVPVRIPDAAAVGLLDAGDRVDLVATDPTSGQSESVASDVTVVSVPAATDTSDAGLGLGGRLVVLAVPVAEVTQVTSAAVRAYLSVVLAG